MIRKVCALSFLVILITAGYSLAQKPDSDESKATQETKQKSTTKRDHTRSGPYCLQGLWLEYPGPDGSYYVCQYFRDGCDNPPIEMIWQGNPNSGNEMPQDCDNCEGDRSTTRSGDVEGHGLKLNEKTGWLIMQAGLANADPPIDVSSLRPSYHKIPKATMQALGIDHAVYFIAVRLEATGKLDGPRYLGIETDPLPDAILDHMTTTFEPPVKGPGAQLRISYKVGTDPRQGFLLLKDQERSKKKK